MFRLTSALASDLRTAVWTWGKNIRTCLCLEQGGPKLPGGNIIRLPLRAAKLPGGNTIRLPLRAAPLTSGVWTTVRGWAKYSAAASGIRSLGANGGGAWRFHTYAQTDGHTDTTRRQDPPKDPPRGDLPKDPPRGDPHKDPPRGVPPKNPQECAAETDEKKKNVWKSALSTMIGVASKVAGVVVALVAVYEFFATYWPSIVFKKRVENARITDTKVSKPVMPRKELVEKLHTKIVNPAVSRYALVVSGPRGTGKSCAVRMAVEGHAGTVVVPFVSSMEDDLWDTIGVNRLAPGTQVNILMRSFLKKLHKPPIFILEVDTKCTAKDIETLLLKVKRWGFEDELARFVVIVSGSRILGDLRIPLPQLRCDYVEVGDLSKKEAEEFARRIFCRLSDGEAVNKLVERVVDNCGGRLLFLQALKHRVNEAGGKEYQSVEKAVDTYIQQQISQCLGDIQWIAFAINKMTVCKHLCKELLEGQPVYLRDLIDPNIKERLNMEDIQKFKIAYVIYVDPQSRLISIGSRFMEKAMEQFVKE